MYLLPDFTDQAGCQASLGSGGGEVPRSLFSAGSHTAVAKDQVRGPWKEAVSEALVSGVSGLGGFAR